MRSNSVSARWSGLRGRAGTLSHALTHHPVLMLPIAAFLALALTGLPTATLAQTATTNVVSFTLTANPKTVACLAKSPSDTSHPPTASVTVERGDQHDRLRLHLSNIKPDLQFDLFTVQRSNLLANGQPDPSFKNFGLAWYQTDVEANSAGSGDVAIQTIVLDQIFGFDPDVSLVPTNTFHVGFWFNNPADAAACGFTGVTPFNGDHNAGPLAMISLPNATTGLGPLCTQPNTSTSPASCHP